MTDQPRLYDLSFSTIEALLTDWGQPSYRAQQVWEWLYCHQATSFDEMTNLPLALRERLAEAFDIGIPEVVATQISPDGLTRKDLLRFRDGKTVEVVLMEYERRHTVCISTQVGCAVGCIFCATGQTGLSRDLSAGEVVAQVLHAARAFNAKGERLTNVVLMGMGEPLLNYDASLTAVRRLIDPRGLNLGQRHITLSTVGVVPGILRLSEEELQITLAISLHAATDDLRGQLVPMNRRYPLDELFAACYQYFSRTGRRISFEWALIDGINDSVRQAKALAARLIGFETHVNLIPLNPSPGYDGRPASPEAIQAFTDVLDHRGIPYTIRLRRGIEIQAGCGQLRHSTK
ncbi:MAG: 23S rRNA (adenine(2503)-C(2))-methyltransferase RlmN [Anaerolineae bacterium]|jgi:23S rRNA (adenine2503-C2)-methyltransferase